MDPTVVIGALIPVFNNASTVGSVIRECLRHVSRVIVVDDGSTDSTAWVLEREPVILVRHEANRGKGEAIRSGLSEARRHGLTHVITLDADGQHDPQDLPGFVRAVRAHPRCLVCGYRDFTLPSVPRRSRVGRDVSAFWMRRQTGRDIRDCQCGYRGLPVEAVLGLNTRLKRYEFEVETLVQALWNGIPVVEIPIRTIYGPSGERSSFRPIGDNVRFSWFNFSRTVLAALRRFPSRKPSEPIETSSTAAPPVDRAVASGLGAFLRVCFFGRPAGPPALRFAQRLHLDPHHFREAAGLGIAHGTPATALSLLAVVISIFGATYDAGVETTIPQFHVAAVWLTRIHLTVACVLGIACVTGIILGFRTYRITRSQKDQGERDTN